MGVVGTNISLGSGVGLMGRDAKAVLRKRLVTNVVRPALGSPHLALAGVGYIQRYLTLRVPFGL